MLLISRVIDYDINLSIRAEYDITEDCLFYDSALGGVPAWAGFEFMAQAVSALSGLRFRERGEKPLMGFILSIPSMKMNIPVFEPGSSLDIRVTENMCADTIYSFEGEIFLEEKKVMEGKLMAMEVTSEEQFKKILKELE
jgi:predicted hotdog family 3-hydroxylacyl-ACP dehydratase